MTNEQSERIINDFYEATIRAIKAGFDGVELHGANGYLIQQFFSPYSNQRKDQWGGTIQKRLRFPLAVVQAVQKAVAETKNVEIGRELIDLIDRRVPVIGVGKIKSLEDVIAARSYGYDLVASIF